MGIFPSNSSFFFSFKFALLSLSFFSFFGCVFIFRCHFSPISFAFFSLDYITSSVLCFFSVCKRLNLCFNQFSFVCARATRETRTYATRTRILKETFNVDDEMHGHGRTGGRGKYRTRYRENREAK